MGGAGGFAADTTIQLNNSTPAAVNAWRSLIALPVATPGGERSDWTLSMLDAGAVTTPLYVRGDNWIGIGTTTVALSATASGGITMLGVGTSGPRIEMKAPTATAAGELGSLNFFNGTLQAAVIQSAGSGATNSGDLRFYASTGGSLGQVATINSAGLALANAKHVTLTQGNLVLDGASNGQIRRSGGGLTFGTLDSNIITFMTISTGRGNITTGGDWNIGNTNVYATTATAGFLNVPSCAGTPTGVPTPDSGKVPLVVDVTGNKLWGFYGAAWHDLTGA